MSKFKVGDKVVRTRGGQFRNSSEGSEHVVRSIEDNLLRFEGDYVYGYSADNYELVPPEQPTEVPALTPKEVLQAVVDGKELQVQHIASKTWSDVDSDDVSINWATGRKVRIKPTTVEINGTEIVQPKLDNAVKYSQKCYTLSEGLQTVIEARPAFVADSKLYWDTREDAWAALKAITAVLRGE